MTDRVDLLMVCDPSLSPQLDVRGAVNSDPASYIAWKGWSCSLRLSSHLRMRFLQLILLS